MPFKMIRIEALLIRSHWGIAKRIERNYSVIVLNFLEYTLLNRPCLAGVQHKDVLVSMYLYMACLSIIW